MVSYYVDENKTIYAHVSDKETSVVAGDSANVTLGLADLLDLTGQSTIIVNRIHFGVICFVNSAVPIYQTATAFVLGGIVPVGYPSPTGGASNVANFGDYQEIKGWPLKGVSKTLSAMPSGQTYANSIERTSYHKTWTPSRKNALALNRGQEIVLNVQTNHETLNYVLSINLEARRGV